VDGRDKPGHDKVNERIGRAKKAAEILVFADLGA
jgi:dihydroxyacetone kinase DhaKLM complex PTS-EIIA-like component DhaM